MEELRGQAARSISSGFIERGGGVVKVLVFVVHQYLVDIFMNVGDSFGLLLGTGPQFGEGDLPYFVAHAVGGPSGTVGVIKHVFFTKGDVTDTAVGLFGS